MTTDVAPTDTPEQPPEAAPKPMNAWQRLRSRWWVRWLMDGAIVLAIVWGVTAYQGRNLLDGQQAAPAFTLSDMDGGTHKLEDYRGKTVLISFWAPWCGVCEISNHNVSAVYEDADKDEVAVISIVLGYSTREEIQAYIDEHDVKYPVLLGNPALSKAYKIDKFPTTYVIDPDGNVKHSTIGYATELGLKARL